MYFEHKPVLLKEAVGLLNVKKNGIYVDATLGGGGYALKILSELGNSGKLIAVDCDQEALENFKKNFRNYKNVILVKNNFSAIKDILDSLKIKEIDGIIFDLGVSTHQLFSDPRGFSFRSTSGLDMRMDRELAVSAKDIVNTLTAEELEKIFKEFGEEKFSKRIAAKIAEEREKKEIQTAKDLVEVIEKCVPSKFKNQRIHCATRVFQALRIKVNDELENLKKSLADSINSLKKEGRIAVVAYHSLEDRIVKNVFKSMYGNCVCSKKLPQCVCGAKAALKAVTRKPVLPTEEEIKINPKSRSAKLRAAEKV